MEYITITNIHLLQQRRSVSNLGCEGQPWPPGLSNCNFGPKLGEKVDFNLIFKDGSNKSITAEVKKLEVR